MAMDGSGKGNGSPSSDGRDGGRYEGDKGQPWRGVSGRAKLISHSLTESSIQWLKNEEVNIKKPLDEHEFWDKFLSDLGLQNGELREPQVQAEEINDERTRHDSKTFPGQNTKGARVEEVVMQQELEKWMNQNASKGLHWHPYARNELFDIEGSPDIVVADQRLRNEAKKAKEDSIAAEEILGFIDVKKNLYNQAAVKEGVKQAAHWAAEILRLQMGRHYLLVGLISPGVNNASQARNPDSAQFREHASIVLVLVKRPEKEQTIVALPSPRFDCSENLGQLALKGLTSHHAIFWGFTGPLPSPAHPLCPAVGNRDLQGHQILAHSLLRCGHSREYISPSVYSAWLLDEKCQGIIKALPNVDILLHEEQKQKLQYEGDTMRRLENCLLSQNMAVDNGEYLSLNSCRQGFNAVVPKCRTVSEDRVALIATPLSDDQKDQMLWDAEKLRTRSTYSPLWPTQNLNEYLAAIKGVAVLLNAIHSAGFLHRDVKPSNVITANNMCALVDWEMALESEADGKFASLPKGMVGTSGFASIRLHLVSRNGSLVEKGSGWNHMKRDDWESLFFSLDARLRKNIPEGPKDKLSRIKERYEDVEQSIRKKNEGEDETVICNCLHVYRKLRTLLYPLSIQEVDMEELSKNESRLQEVDGDQVLQVLFESES